MTLARLARCAGLAATVLGAAACSDGNLSDCLESNATRYAYHLPGDSTAVFRWTTARMPVRVYADPTGALPENADSAMVLWVNAFRCGELTLERVADSNVADIILRNPAAMPPLPARAMTLFADSVGACLGRTDGAIDTTATPDSLLGPLRSYVTPNGSDPVAVAGCYRFTVAHELGHALGLLSHSGNAADLMHAVPKRRVATVNDRFTVQLLYQAAPTIRPAAR